MATTVGTRLAFEKAKNAIQAAGFSLGQAVLSQSYLRTELELSTTKTLYQFPILVNDNSQGTPPNTCNLLNLQDAFYCSSLFIGFAKPSSSTDTTFQLCTYPNSSIFSAANTASSLYSFYNGTLSLTVNNRQIVPSYDVVRHYDVPWQQQVTAPYYAAQTAAWKDSNNLSEDGFYPVEPGWVLVGSKQNVLQISIPAALAAIEANSRVVVIMRGHLGQNITSVR